MEGKAGKYSGREGKGSEGSSWSRKVLGKEGANEGIKKIDNIEDHMVKL